MPRLTVTESKLQELLQMGVKAKKKKKKGKNTDCEKTECMDVNKRNNPSCELGFRDKQ